MKLLVEIRTASPEARNTRYVAVVVNAADGGAAQRQAMAVVQQKYPHLRVSGGTVYNATDDVVAKAKERFGEVLHEVEPAEPDPERVAPVRGVRQRKSA